MGYVIGGFVGLPVVAWAWLMYMGQREHGNAIMDRYRRETARAERRSNFYTEA